MVLRDFNYDIALCSSRIMSRIRMNYRTKIWRQKNPGYKKQWDELNREEINAYRRSAGYKAGLKLYLSRPEVKIRTSIVHKRALKKYRGKPENKIKEKLYNKTYREFGKEIIKKAIDKYRKTKKAKDTKHKYYIDHRDKILARKKELYKLNKDKKT